MKVKNQWIVFHANHEKLLVETENGKFLIQNRNHSFEDLTFDEAQALINCA